MRFLAVACLVGCLSIGCGTEHEPQPGCTLVLLVVAYETNEFEGGREVSFPPYTAPPTDSLPLIVHYETPGDFGSIAFEYVDTADTVFYGSIVWAGRGEMLVPETLDDPTGFARVPRDTPLPAKFENYRIWGDKESWLADRNAAWGAIDDLAVVKDMSESPYPVGAYLYPPTVGAFDPDVADWVFFFFESEQ